MLNPILASSALRRMRSVRTIVIIGVYVAVLMALLCLGMSTFIFGSTFDINSMSAGITTYCLLMAAQFALIVLVAPAMTAGSIAGERERQTLELLLVTNTGSLSIILTNFIYKPFDRFILDNTYRASAKSAAGHSGT